MCAGDIGGGGAGCGFTAQAWPAADGAMSDRAPGNPADLIDAIRAAAWSVDKDQPIVRLAT
jgi:hypothetical protein